jgi:hypothetical protein
MSPNVDKELKPWKGTKERKTIAGPLRNGKREKNHSDHT